MVTLIMSKLLKVMMLLIMLIDNPNEGVDDDVDLDVDDANNIDVKY